MKYAIKKLRVVFFISLYYDRLVSY